MNFKPELLDKVLAGSKTQTRRPIRGVYLWVDVAGNPCASDVLTPAQSNKIAIKTVISEKTGRLIYQRGKVLAACPGRGKVHKALIRITEIRREDVRTICTEDVQAEGFADHLEFFKVWTGFYDKTAYKFLCAVNDPLRCDDLLSDRPDHLYDALALDFELVN